jgi:hypothetical protein
MHSHGHTARSDSSLWYQFNDVTKKDVVWRVNASFLLSNWNCIYGRGCAGIFGATAETYQPDVACCVVGTHLTAGEVERLDGYVAEMTEEDIGPKGLAYIRKHGWRKDSGGAHDPGDMDAYISRTRLRDGGCVMAKRAGDGDKKTGCAFVHYGNRMGKPDHISVMPLICWRVPLMLSHETEPYTLREVRVVHPVDADVWGDGDEPEERDTWMKWWCTDTPDAYTGTNPVYRLMGLELKAMMGDANYDKMCEYLDKQDPGTTVPMPGAVANGGRPMLPLIVGNRTPRRCH